MSAGNTWSHETPGQGIDPVALVVFELGQQGTTAPLDGSHLAPAPVAPAGSLEAMLGLPAGSLGTSEAQTPPGDGPNP